jgi:hypothetical protein
MNDVPPRPQQPEGPYVGDRRKNPNTNKLEAWNGTEWIPVPEPEKES